MEPLNLRNKRVLVTGASSGLGRELARQLILEHGAIVIGVARRADRLDALRAELGPKGERFEPLVGDPDPGDPAAQCAGPTDRGRSTMNPRREACRRGGGVRLGCSEATTTALSADAGRASGLPAAPQESTERPTT